MLSKLAIFPYHPLLVPQHVHDCLQCQMLPSVIGPYGGIDLYLRLRVDAGVGLGLGLAVIVDGPFVYNGDMAVHGDYSNYYTIYQTFILA